MPSLLILFVLIGLLMIGLAIPLILGRVPPNHWYGFRIRLTLDDPSIWYPANRYAAWLLLVVGGVVIVAAMVLAVALGITAEAYGLWVSAIMMVGVLLCPILSGRCARRLTADLGHGVEPEARLDPNA